MTTRKRPYASDDPSQTERLTTEEETKDDDIDPLDAFMKEVEEEMKTQQHQPKIVRVQGASRCDDLQDPVADYMEARKERGYDAAALALLRTGTKEDSDEEVYAAAKVATQDLEAEFDSDDQLLITKREIGLLPPLDYDSIAYEDFDKDFYEPTLEVKNKTKEEVERIRDQNGIKIAGFEILTPVESFFQCGFDLSLLSVIKKQKYEKPTPIQMQTLPVALSGRDVVGLAKTGSGKTAAYLLPLCVHVIAQPALKRGEGPIAIVLAPTRELSEQIHRQARIFAKPYNISVAACFGGLRKYDQVKALKAGSDVVIATPGRMIDLLKAKSCTMRKTTFVVLDEADRMFEMGLEKQVRSILGQIRPDRQTLLFSATMPNRVARLSRDVLLNPVRISVGRVGAANEDVKQIVEVVPSDVHKHIWLADHLSSLVDEGGVLIFANQKQRVEDIASRIHQAGFRVAAIHGDMDQHSRMQILQNFRNDLIHILVATDVAARGLDIPLIKTVVNFDCSKDADGHTHRVGRTGRAGDKEGKAVTLITPQDTRQAAYLVNSMTAAGNEVTEALYDVASKDQRFSRRKGKGKKAIGQRGAGRVGGSGLGFDSGNEPAPETFSQFMPSQTKMESEWTTSMGQLPPVPVGTSAPVQNLTRSYEPNAFHSNFVSSGVQGGDSNQKATVIAPKRALKTFIPPPPVPVTQQPVYMTRPHLPRNAAHAVFPRQRMTQETGIEFQKAFAAAQEIASRFGGSVSKGDPSETKSKFSQQR